MVKTNGADGSSLKNAIVITEASSRGEGWRWIWEFADEFMKKHGYHEYMLDEIFTDEGEEYEAFMFFYYMETVPDKVIYIERSHLFHIADW